MIKAMTKIIPVRIESTDKPAVFQQSARLLTRQGLRLIDLDITRPWGFYLSVDESQTAEFINLFYKDVALNLNKELPLRPKLLAIAPGQRLSWQYHYRRAEIWRCIGGKFDVILSRSDKESGPKTVREGEVIHINQGWRHRGVGLKGWSLIAEIWQHTDPANPSDEEDIVRLQDDFGRS